MSTLTRTVPEVVVGPYPLAPRVVAVEVVETTALRVTFEDGEVREVTPVLDRGPFRRLQDPERFAEVAIVEGGGGVEWASGADLSANRLYYGPDLGWGEGGS
ncbi:MAG: DUF2442 domain-containing protein [Bacteroidota bacterium]